MSLYRRIQIIIEISSGRSSDSDCRQVILSDGRFIVHQNIYSASSHENVSLFNNRDIFTVISITINNDKYNIFVIIKFFNRYEK